jgi:signal transduction histidine kinase
MSGTTGTAEGATVEADGYESLEAARREIAVLREELRRTQEHLTLFAGQASHELRTPLTAVLAHAEMLASEPAVAGSEDLTWMVGGITRAARRLDTMIEQMLEYARDGGVPRLGVVDLGGVFDSVVQVLAPLIAEKAAVVKLGDLPRLPADRDQMYAVALNLLSNSLRFARPDTPPQVTVTAERRDDSWRVTVSDNGIGVAPESRQAMLVLFGRADKRMAGSGIGLAVARRVVEAHGGRIGMTDGEGGGTTVWFELPA